MSQEPVSHAHAVEGTCLKCKKKAIIFSAKPDGKGVCAKCIVMACVMAFLGRRSEPGSRRSGTGEG